MPILSVIIPCFNHGKYVIQCVESVLSTSISKELEIIIVNDGSNDAGFTKNTLDGINDKKVIVLHQENKGLGKTRNVAINLAKGKYILPLDADNFVTDSFLTKSLQILELNNEVDIVYPDRIIVDKNNIQTIRKSKAYNKNFVLLQNYIDACTMYRKSVWEKVNGYDEQMPVMGFEDWEFWIRCSELNFKFYHLKGSYFYYRDLENSMIKSTLISHNEILQYIMKKNIHIYSSLLQEMKAEYSYLNRKPLNYLFRKYLNLPQIWK